MKSPLPLHFVLRLSVEGWERVRERGKLIALMIENFTGLKIAVLFLLFILLLRLILKEWQKIAVQFPLPFEAVS